jgi:zinc protease
MERLKREGPTPEEMQRAAAGLEFQFVSALESNLGRAEMLLSGSVFHGDPAHYRTRFTQLKAVTADDVRRVANRYLGAGRVVLSIVPQGKPDQASKPEHSRTVSVSPDGGHYIMEAK